VQSGKRSLFSKTRPSRGVVFQHVLQTIFLQNKLYLLSPLRSKRATLYINVHGRVCCFGAAKPGRRAKSRRVFALGPVVHSIHIQTVTVNRIQLKPPPSPPYLQGTRPFGRSYYNVHSYCSEICSMWYLNGNTMRAYRHTRYVRSTGRPSAKCSLRSRTSRQQF
jgi:hypothetical protein